MIYKQMETLKIAPFVTYLLLSLIVVLSTSVRLIRFRKKGLFLWDEAAYYREARSAIALIGFIFKHGRELIRLKRNPNKERTDVLYKELRFSTPAILITYYKPWHLLLNSITVRIFGHKDYGVAAPSILLGAGSVAGVFFAMDAVLGPVPALLAAFALSVSGLHFLHSRSSEPEIGSSLCYLLVFTLSVHYKMSLDGAPDTFTHLFSVNSMLLLVGCGFFLCGTLCFNPLWLPLFPFFYFISEVLYAVMSGKTALPVFAVAQSIVFVSAAVFFIITDIPYIFLSRYFPEVKVESNTKRLINTISKLLGLLRFRLKPKTIEFVRPPKWHRFTFYPHVLLHTEGAAVLLASMGGLVVLALRRSPLDVLIAFQAAYLFLFLTFVPYKAARALMPLIPFIYICAGVFFAAIPFWAFLPLVTWITLRGAAYIARAAGITSGMKKAAEYINGLGREYFQCTSAPFVLMYGPPLTPPVSPLNYESVLRAYKIGFRHLIADHHVYYPGMNNDNIIPYIEQNLKPVFTVDDPAVTFFPIKAECEYYAPDDYFFDLPAEWISDWNRFLNEPSPQDKTIRIYDLDEFFGNKDLLSNCSSVYLHLATEMIRDGKHNDAIGMLKKGARLAKDKKIFNLYTAMCYISVGRKEWAKKILIEMLKEENLFHQYRNKCNELLKRCE